MLEKESGFLSKKCIIQRGSGLAFCYNGQKARPDPLDFLKGLRYREGLSQIEFAKQLNISQTNLSAMENGRRIIGKELAKRIADIFELDYRIFL